MPVPPRVPLALLPTPIVKLERLSRRLGVELYLKRDDLTGLLEAGGEVRKLEFLAAEALAEGADTLVGGGRGEADGGRTLAAVAARLGLGAVVVLAEAQGQGDDDGDVLLDRLLGAEVYRLASDEAVEDAVGAIAARLRTAGRQPYLIPERGANEVGALGYLECAVELAEQLNHGAPRFDSVVVTAWTGVSQAGLLMGKQLAGLPCEIVGVPVAAAADRVRDRIADVIRRAIRRSGFAIDVPKAIHLLDGHQRPMAAETDDRDLLALIDLAREEGLILDPHGSGRAFGALVERLERDAGALGQRVCFIHDAGPFGVFSLRDRLGRLLDRRPGASA